MSWIKDRLSEEIAAKRLRSFGLLVGGTFAVIGLWPVLFHGAAPRLWALIVAALLVIPAVALPRSLRLVYLVWMAVGHLLGWINTKIILGVLFYGMFTPMGLIRRLLGRDAMHRKFEPSADTYRVMRQPRATSHMKRQF